MNYKLIIITSLILNGCFISSQDTEFESVNEVQEPYVHWPGGPGPWSETPFLPNETWNLLKPPPKNQIYGCSGFDDAGALVPTTIFATNEGEALVEYGIWHATEAPLSERRPPNSSIYFSWGCHSPGSSFWRCHQESPPCLPLHYCFVYSNIPDELVWAPTEMEAADLAEKIWNRFNIPPFGVTNCSEISEAENSSWNCLTWDAEGNKARCTTDSISESYAASRCLSACRDSSDLEAECSGNWSSSQAASSPGHAGVVCNGSVISTSGKFNFPMRNNEEWWRCRAWAHRENTETDFNYRWVISDAFRSRSGVGYELNARIAGLSIINFGGLDIVLNPIHETFDKPVFWKIKDSKLDHIQCCELGEDRFDNCEWTEF